MTGLIRWSFFPRKTGAQCCRKAPGKKALGKLTILISIDPIKEAAMRSRAGNGRSLSPLKRARIIHAGKAVFLAQGFGAASVDDIAATAGVSKMTVYRHFR